MARIKLEHPETAEEEFSPVPTARTMGGGSSRTRRYNPVEPGMYFAEIVEFTEGTYKGKAYDDNRKQVKSNAPGGKWDYVKITPQIEIPFYRTDVDEDGNKTYVETHRHIINRQDFTVGVWANNTFWNPGKGSTERAIWRGLNGAYSMLYNMGFFDIENGEMVLDYAPQLWKNRVMKIGVGLGAYQRNPEGRSTNYAPDQFREWLVKEALQHADQIEDEEFAATFIEWANTVDLEAKDVYRSDLSLDVVQAAVNAYNEAEGMDETNAVSLKSVVTYWGAVSQEDADYRGWYRDEATGQVFLSEMDYWDFQDKQALEEGKDPFDTSEENEDDSEDMI